jgi:adenylate cyclase
VALDPTVPFGHKALCTAVGFGRDFERARQAIDQALELAPNDADALVTRGAVLIFGGDPAAGIPDIERGRRLDPAGTLNAMHLLGLGHLLLGNYETAAAYFRERILLVPETDFSRAFLAAALGHLGRGEEARRVWGEIETVNPDYSFARHRSRMPFVNPADGERIAEGLRKAGITA